MKYGKLTVLHTDVGVNRFNKSVWVCRCDCGEVCIKIASALRTGKTKSCGCLQSAGNRRTHGQRVSNNGRSSKAYSAWQNMKNRCDWKNNSQWYDYGGRGIKYCASWARFENFLRDMGNPPPGLTLDRINNDGNYSKANCRWADKATQRRNSTSHVMWVTIDGKKMILTDACRKYKVVSQQCASSRIYNGWNAKDAVLTPYTRSDNKGYREF